MANGTLTPTDAAMAWAPERDAMARRAKEHDADIAREAARDRYLQQAQLQQHQQSGMDRRSQEQNAAARERAMMQMAASMMGTQMRGQQYITAQEAAAKRQTDAARAPFEASALNMLGTGDINQFARSDLKDFGVFDDEGVAVDEYENVVKGWDLTKLQRFQQLTAERRMLQEGLRKSLTAGDLDPEASISWGDLAGGTSMGFGHGTSRQDLLTEDLDRDHALTIQSIQDRFSQPWSRQYAGGGQGDPLIGPGTRGFGSHMPMSAMRNLRAQLLRNADPEIIASRQAAAQHRIEQQRKLHSMGIAPGTEDNILNAPAWIANQGHIAAIAGGQAPSLLTNQAQILAKVSSQLKGSPFADNFIDDLKYATLANMRAVAHANRTGDFTALRKDHKKLFDALDVNDDDKLDAQELAQGSTLPQELAEKAAVTANAPVMVQGVRRENNRIKNQITQVNRQMAGTYADVLAVLKKNPDLLQKYLNNAGIEAQMEAEGKDIDEMRKKGYIKAPDYVAKFLTHSEKGHEFLDILTGSDQWQVDRADSQLDQLIELKKSLVAKQQQIQHMLPTISNVGTWGSPGVTPGGSKNYPTRF